MNDLRRGGLIGLAVGDALGVAVEFSRPGTFTPVTGYRGGGPHGLNSKKEPPARALLAAPAMRKPDLLSS